MINVKVVENVLNFRLNEINSEVFARFCELIDGKRLGTIVVHNFEYPLKADETSDTTFYQLLSEFVHRLINFSSTNCKVKSTLSFSDVFRRCDECFSWVGL